MRSDASEAFRLSLRDAFNLIRRQRIVGRRRVCLCFSSAHILRRRFCDNFKIIYDNCHLCLAPLSLSAKLHIQIKQLAGREQARILYLVCGGDVLPVRPTT